MSGFHLTDSQQAAVEARNEAVLVSAGAGSGKTRVLVERLMTRITDEKAPKDVDSFLIITFTKAAAAELRERITRRLSELCAEDPASKRLRRQVALCARAPIGTIHSFCASILRENAHVLGIAPDFRVADEEKCARLQSLALERVLEKAYAHIEEDGEFQLLADTLGAGRDDSRLETAVLELHKKMSSHIFPEKWAEQCIADLPTDSGGDAGDTLWGRWLLEDAGENAAAWGQRMEALALEAEADEKIAAAYGDSLRETALSLRDFARATEEGWDRAGEFLPIRFPKLKPLRDPENPELAGRIKAQRDMCKKKAAEVYAERFAERSPAVLEPLLRSAPAVRGLLKLTMTFAREYEREKRRLGLLDFSDLEHYSVRLLLDEKTGEPTAAAREISRRFTEIMVDEYQDVNAVQDAIFSAVSKNEENLFMVGDVKQSIYRFRLADPTIFLRRYDAFGKGEGGRRILLRENFRSRKGVLDTVNRVFGSIMSRQLGELDYDENAMLVPGGEFPDADRPCVSFTVVAQETDDPEAPDALETEARAVARQIRDMVSRGERITVEDGQRPVEWDDIAILLRSANTTGGSFRRALEALHIPVQGEQGNDFFSEPEVAVMLHLLKLTDNPGQDIPLISVLRSALFGFTADELSAIRAAAPGESFYGALLKKSGTDEKCRRFLDTLEALRRDAEDLPLSGLLWSIFTRTDALALAGAMEGGRQKRENLLRLSRMAAAFEMSGDGSLGGFTEHLEQLRDKGGEASAAPGGSGVRILSIHKSKGLEFPVVFLCCTARRFNTRDTAATAPIHGELGLGLKYMDTERGVEYPTIARMAVSRKLLLESLSEEMRVLYVAMTRAKEFLHITCAMDDPEEKLEKLSFSGQEAAEPCILETGRSYADWLLPVFTREDSSVKVQVFRPGEEEPAPSPCPEERAMAEETETALLPDLDRLLGYRYPFERISALPVKLTATELKSRAKEIVGDEEAGSLVPKMKPLFRRPQLSGEKTFTGAEKGTATHLVLQYIRPEKTDTEENIRMEIARLTESGILTPEEAGALDEESVFRFFRSELGALMRSGAELMREQRFSVLVPAEDYFSGAEGEEILMQGIVDCCIREPDGLTILDFKTDHVTGERLTRRAEGYMPQLRAYASAMSRLTGQKVKRCVLAFLFAGETVEVPLPEICGPESCGGSF